jgi:hypothetical protein
MTHTGVVAFHELGPELTRVLLGFDVDPGSLIETFARGSPRQARPERRSASLEGVHRDGRIRNRCRRVTSRPTKRIKRTTSMRGGAPERGHRSAGSCVSARARHGAASSTMAGDRSPRGLLAVVQAAPARAEHRGSQLGAQTVWAASSSGRSSGGSPATSGGSRASSSGSSRGGGRSQSKSGKQQREGRIWP